MIINIKINKLRHYSTEGVEGTIGSGRPWLLFFFLTFSMTTNTGSRLVVVELEWGDDPTSPNNWNRVLLIPLQLSNSFSNFLIKWQLNKWSTVSFIFIKFYKFINIMIKLLY